MRGKGHRWKEGGMRKRGIAVLLGASLIILVVGYWLRGQERRPQIPLAALPPAQALGFIALPGLPQAWADVRSTRFFQHVSSPAFWQAALGPETYERLSERKRSLEQRLGFPITEQTVGPLLAREFGLALVPSRRDGWPLDMVAYIRVSSTEKLLESLTRMFSQAKSDVVRETQTVENVEIITLHPKGLPTSVSYAFMGTLAILSTDPTWIVDAIKAQRGSASERLNQTPVFRDLQLDAARSLLAYGYFDTEGMPGRIMGEGDGVGDASKGAALRGFQPVGKVSMKATREGDGIRVEARAISPQHGGAPWFRQPAKDGATPSFSGVPAETFFLTYFDLLDLQGLGRWLSQSTPGASQPGLSRQLDQLQRRTGTDLERDVLPTFTGGIGLGMAGPPGSQGGRAAPLPNLFLALGIRDEQQARQLIQRIGANTGGPLFSHFAKSLTYDGHEMQYLANPLLFVKPGYVISRQHLILATDVSLLQRMLDAASGKTRPLAETDAYRHLFKRFRLQGGSTTFIEVATALDQVKDAWAQLGFLAKSLQPFRAGDVSSALGGADPWTLLELLRPVRYFAATTQAGADGLRTEALVTLEDPK
jgi:hypothetical protein